MHLCTREDLNPLQVVLSCYLYFYFNLTVDKLYRRKKYLRRERTKMNEWLRLLQNKQREWKNYRGFKLVLGILRK
jgi:hypothetical protein